MEEGYPDDKEKWGLDYLVECVPDKFTPEMEKNHQIHERTRNPQVHKSMHFEILEKGIFTKVFCRER